MTKAKRILLISCSVILLCMSIISGMTYALFTEEINVKNHLQAGNLDVTLTRTNLTYAMLDTEGYLTETTNEDDLSLTTSTDENVFGLTDDAVIVPGSFFDAELTLTNDGNVAFEYGVKLVILSTDVDKDLADQIVVTIKGTDGAVVVDKKPISEMTSKDAILVGKMGRNAAGATAEKHVFNVKVEFLDDVTNNLAKPNNDVMKQSVAFDLIVEAVQAKK